MPWVQTAEASTLLTEAETRAVLEAPGSVSFGSTIWARRRWAGPKQGSGPPQPGGVNASMIDGARMTEIAGNFVRNLREGQMRLMAGLADKAS